MKIGLDDDSKEKLETLAVELREFTKAINEMSKELKKYNAG